VYICINKIIKYDRKSSITRRRLTNINMTNQDKAALYEELIRESDALQRANSKLKSEYVTSIPPNIQQIIDNNDKKIATIVGKFEQLMR